MTLVVAGDIGGTKTILRLVQLAEGTVETLHQATYSSQQFPDLVPMMQQFIATSGRETPQQGCFAIAGPVLNNTSQLTNLNWSLSSDLGVGHFSAPPARSVTTDRLAQELKMTRVSLINDFAAASYGILGLADSDLQTLQSGERDKNAPLGVIGAGTGLGQAFLVPVDSEYHVFATEGGHSDFAPQVLLEFELLVYLQEKYATDHISVERVVSGQGIVAIYQFLRDSQFLPESPTIADAIRTWEGQEKDEKDRIDPAAIIASSALAKEDPLCVKVMEMFVTAYGREAGNLALKLLPYGGLYIGGGIAAKILPLMTDGSFLRAFQQKEQLSYLLERIPVHVILNPEVGLVGSVLYALRR